MKRLRKIAILWLLLGGLGAALERQSTADYRDRRQRLAMETHGGVVVLFAPLAAEGPNAIYGFRQDDNFYYLSGWSEPGSALLIAPAEEATVNAPARPYTEILFLPARNPIEERWTGPQLGPEDPQSRKITGFDRVQILDKLAADLAALLPKQRPSSLYSDLPSYGEGAQSTAGLDWLKRAQAFSGLVSFVDVKPLLSLLRTYKDAGEVALIQKATDASIAAHWAALGAVRPGVTEREISSLMQYQFGRLGCERPAYAPIVGAGVNSTTLHYSENSSTMQAGDLVVLDVAGEYSMYASDITRTLPVNGKFSSRQREIYDIVLGAQQAAVRAFVAGKSKLRKGDADSLYQVAYEYINTHGQDLHGEPLGKYFIHGLGHYVGLNVHDAGDYSRPLAPGMVFTIEPGIYIPEEKLGVRIEDIFFVDRQRNLVKLSGALPASADDVEQAMARHGQALKEQKKNH